MKWATSFSAVLGCAFLVVSGGCSQKPAKIEADLIRDLQHKDEAVRSYAARELGKASGAQATEAVKALSEALKDSSAYVRKAAVGSLGAHGARAKEAIPVLQKALKDSDEGVRLEAVTALKKIQGS